MQGNIYQPTISLTPLNPNQHDSLLYYTSDTLWGIYKPHNLSSTRGKQTSILDLLLTDYAYHEQVISGLNTFGHAGELGMLTRLDHDTAGMLWFAQTPEIKQQWLNDQSQHLITKIYHADTIGWIHEPQMITTPLAHHRYDDRLMVVVTDHTAHKIRGNIHTVSTTITPLAVSGSMTHIQACIHQGCKHQIRVHCNSIGHPLVGESLYHKGKSDSILHLWSCGIDWRGEVLMIDKDKLFS